MAVDFTKGRYNVYAGRGPSAPQIGNIDGDEFIRSPAGELVYRIDGLEVYTAGTSTRFVGDIKETDAGRAMVVDASLNAVLTIVPEFGNR